jgi:hypothetical protein
MIRYNYKAEQKARCARRDVLVSCSERVECFHATRSHEVSEKAQWPKLSSCRSSTWLLQFGKGDPLNLPTFIEIHDTASQYGPFRLVILIVRSAVTIPYHAVA